MGLVFKNRGPRASLSPSATLGYGMKIQGEIYGQQGGSHLTMLALKSDVQPPEL